MDASLRHGYGVGHGAAAGRGSSAAGGVRPDRGRGAAGALRHPPPAGECLSRAARSNRRGVEPARVHDSAVLPGAPPGECRPGKPGARRVVRLGHVVLGQREGFSAGVFWQRSRKARGAGQRAGTGTAPAPRLRAACWGSTGPSIRPPRTRCDRRRAAWNASRRGSITMRWRTSPSIAPPCTASSPRARGSFWTCRDSARIDHPAPSRLTMSEQELSV